MIRFGILDGATARRTWLDRRGLLRAILAGGLLATTMPLPEAVAKITNVAGPSDDTDQPIEIDADNLEVQQDKNLAIFSGNVDASQGRIKLRADQLRVWYRPAGEGSAELDGTIVRIDAIGRVFISSTDETAQGDLGVYDVAEKRITLTGTVVLTRGENVIRGKQLLMNLATGHSEISGGRVRGRFVPPKPRK
ncbi:MAG: lipopolysaccharide transport periplasmic protein LptA [Alphaproteobacteria bacterium]|jgi:lipopolysaccharide export system protein LptA|nr:lipopolysaccharide transport periplasmic protein LptA [Alphaproteobacteria bacterium]MDP6563616.1 lipopolysaccharide transport periplasmic protein LptA [Alphaproteobacteria bacterium]MDP6814587.1 lipopolysaccharide transport periplasmic protein LptA [Alphaproteobacteria bacterium]